MLIFYIFSDQEKENNFNRGKSGTTTSNGKNASRPEQLDGGGESAETKRRLSDDDSAVSVRSHPEPSETVVVKKAIILPIMAKHHKEAMLRAAAAKALNPTADITSSPTRTVPEIPALLPEVPVKDREPGKPISQE
jgi:hypothetical protein